MATEDVFSTAPIQDPSANLGLTPLAPASPAPSPIPILDAPSATLPDATLAALSTLLAPKSAIPFPTSADAAPLIPLSGAGTDYDPQLARATNLPTRAIVGATNTLADFFSAHLPGPFGNSSSSTMPRVDPNYQKNLNALTNKYTELAPLYQQLSPEHRAALMRLDADRVTRGAPGLTKNETFSAMKLLSTGEQTTPDKKRSVWNVLGNAASDLGDVVKSVGQILPSLVNETRDLFNWNSNYRESRDQGMNPLAAFLHLPGIRMIPGAYVAGNTARGTEGIRENITHPLISALDILPYAGKAASATRVGRAGAELAEAAGRKPRPLADVLLRRVTLNPDGTIARAGQSAPLPAPLRPYERDVMYKGRRIAPTEEQLARSAEISNSGLPILQRNAFGNLFYNHLIDTRVGQGASAVGGYLPRLVENYRNSGSVQSRLMLSDKLTPTTAAEKVNTRVGQFLAKWGDIEGVRIPENESTWTPEQQVAAANLIDKLETGNFEGLPPELVADARALQDEVFAGIHREELGLYDGERWDAETAAKLNTSKATLDSARARHEIAAQILDPDFDLAQARAWLQALRRRDTRWTSRSDLAAEARLLAWALHGRGVDMNIKNAMGETPFKMATAINASNAALRAPAVQAFVTAATRALERHVADTEGLLGKGAGLGPPPMTGVKVVEHLDDVEKANRLALGQKLTARDRLRAERIIRNVTRLRDGFKDPNPKHLTAAIRALGRNIHGLDPEFVNGMIEARHRIALAQRADQRRLSPTAARIEQMATTHAKREVEKAPARLHPLLNRMASKEMTRRVLAELELRYAHADKHNPAPELPRDLETASMVPRHQADINAAMDLVRAGDTVTYDLARSHYGGDTITDIQIRNVTPEQAGHVANMVLQGRYANMGMDHAEVAAIAREVSRDITAQWRELRDSFPDGQGPIFVHRVSPERVNEAIHPTPDIAPPDPSQLKERSIDASPSVNSLEVSLSHEAMELLQRENAENLIDFVADNVGIEESVLREMFIAEGQARYAKNPALDLDGHIKKAMERTYERLNPAEAGFAWGGSRLNKYTDSSIWIPRSVSANLKFHARKPFPVTQVMDSVNNVFRFNVIGLSPQVTLNNMLANMVSAVAYQEPRVLLQFPKAWRIIRALNRGENVEHLLSRDMIVMSSQEHHAISSAARQKFSKLDQYRITQAKFIQSFNARHAWSKSITDRISYENRNLHPSERAAKVVTGLAEKNIQLQVLGDQVARTMSYLHELERGTRKGASRATAERNALLMAQKTLINYLDFTPIERAAMRSIIPFYSYASFAARYAMRYPFDHPLRISVMASVSQIVADDMQGMPGSYLGFIPVPDWLPFLGGKSEDGSRTFLSTRPLDPFSGVADMASVAGWIAQTGPLPQALLSTLGIQRGEQDLFPTMEWNPDTGRMEAVQDESFLGNLFTAAAPRLQTALTPFGLNSKYNALREKAPDAATRSLLSGAGLPTSWRRLNPNMDAVKAELNRAQSQTQVLNRALKSGDWSNADLYPGLAPQRAQIEALQANAPGLLAMYQNASPEQIKAYLEAASGTSGQ